VRTYLIVEVRVSPGVPTVHQTPAECVLDQVCALEVCWGVLAAVGAASTIPSCFPRHVVHHKH